MMAAIDASILHFEKSEGEMRDALHRIRPVRMDDYSPPPRVYLLSNKLDLTEEIDGTLTSGGVRELRRTLTTEIDDLQHQATIRREFLTLIDESSDPIPRTELVNSASCRYQYANQVLEDLLSEDVLERVVESDGPGRPTELFRRYSGST